MTLANISPRKRGEVPRAVRPRPTDVLEAEREARRGAAQLAADTRAATAEVLAARCPGCGYTYEVEAGNELEGFAAGTAWADVPDDWCCPDCGVREKVDFVPSTATRVLGSRLVAGAARVRQASACASRWRRDYESTRTMTDADVPRRTTGPRESDRGQCLAAAQACPVLALTLPERG